MGSLCSGALAPLPRPCCRCVSERGPGPLPSPARRSGLRRAIDRAAAAPPPARRVRMRLRPVSCRWQWWGCWMVRCAPHYKLPTILGESVSYEDASPVPAGHVSFARTHGTGRSLLMQQQLGGPCTKPWNCQEGLVCRDDLCQTCDSNEECMAGNDKEQCFKRDRSRRPGGCAVRVRPLVASVAQTVPRQARVACRCCDASQTRGRAVLARVRGSLICVGLCWVVLRVCADVQTQAAV